MSARARTGQKSHKMQYSRFELLRISISVDGFFPRDQARAFESGIVSF